MNIKFNKPLSNYKYLLAFDLAKKLTGWSFLDFKNDKILLAGVIDTSKMRQTDMIWAYFSEQVSNVVNRCLDKIEGYDLCSILVTKEQLPVQNGKFSTIATLQSLAQVHAVFDLTIFQLGLDTYDDVGVHSVAVKAYFRKILDIQSPQKEDIAKYIYQKYNTYDFSDCSLDVTDSLGVSLTLLNKKWNSDIQSEITKKKKELKSAKSSNKIAKLQSEIEQLQSLRLEAEEKIAGV